MMRVQRSTLVVMMMMMTLIVDMAWVPSYPFLPPRPPHAIRDLPVLVLAAG